MARSRKKTPVISVTTARSEKADKRLTHRVERRTNKVILGMTKDDVALKQVRELSDPWCFGKDGKRYVDPKKCVRELRK